MKSMTGFGKSLVETSDFQLDVSARAVNGRYLEVKVYGPKIYNDLELEIRKRVSKHILRGNLDIYINRKLYNGSEEIQFNTKLAKKWLSGFKKMAKDLNLDPNIDSAVLLERPEFIKVEEASQLTSKEKTALFKAIDQAVKSCSQVRAVEGESLKTDISKHLSKLNQVLSKIKKLRASTVKKLQERYTERLKKLDMPGEIDEQRLAQEIVIMVDKSDISEEIQRLEAHLTVLQKLINQNESIGKKLDFYAQELLREVNTIGSKSGSSELTQAVVEAKTCIEKYREQVQNVE